ncbi:MAG: CPBP family intramembrane metalloprotease [Lachnospiraceae bacterium]|nr:CPBP family intramembrane metalloprotease [Lachnospiraceae bacterium]
MNTKRAGWAYMWMVIFYIVASLVMSFLFEEANTLLAALLTELILIVPVVYYVSRSRAGLREQLHLKGIKPSTVVLSLVYLMCCYPMVLSMNAFSMAVSGNNEAMDITGEFMGLPAFIVWLIIGFVGPVVEELAFRGAIMGGLLSTGRIFTPALLSGLLFGLMHMNLNQFSYTFCVGVMWGLLVEASGSILTSMICHVTMNSISVIMVFALGDSMQELEELVGQGGAEVSAAQYISVGMVFLMIGIGFTALALLLLRVIALNEGRTGCFENIFRRKRRGERYGSLFSVPLVVGMILSFAMIVFTLVLERLW